MIWCLNNALKATGGPSHIARACGFFLLVFFLHKALYIFLTLILNYTSGLPNTACSPVDHPRRAPPSKEDPQPEPSGRSRMYYARSNRRIRGAIWGVGPPQALVPASRCNPSSEPFCVKAPLILPPDASEQLGFDA